MLACSWLAVAYFVDYVSPQDGKRHESFGHIPVQTVPTWLPLPEMPQGGVVFLASPAKIPVDQLVDLVGPEEKRQE